MTVEQVIAAARQLSADDRAEVVAALETDGDEAIGDDGWATDVRGDVRAELLRRTAASDADPSRVLSQTAFDARMSALLANQE